jgi:hypothetical protein
MSLFCILNGHPNEERRKQEVLERTNGLFSFHNMDAYKTMQHNNSSIVSCTFVETVMQMQTQTYEKDL